MSAVLDTVLDAAAAVCLVVGALCGAFNGFWVAYVGLPSLAVTLGEEVPRAMVRGSDQRSPSSTAKRSSCAESAAGSSQLR